MTAPSPQDALLIHAGRVALPGGMLEDGWVLVEEGRIVAVGGRDELGARLHALSSGAPVLDFPALTVAPGFIDLHTHGGGGADTISGDANALAAMAAFYAGHGVTGFLAAAWGVREQIERAIDLAVAAGANPPAGAQILGIFLEGPFLSPHWPGAFQRLSILAPDAALFQAWVERAHGLLRLVTLAPELPGARAIVEIARRNGIVVAAGHTGATFAEIVEARVWGVQHATHMFNAMSPLHHRKPGTVGAILADPEYTAEIIADGIHVHPAVVRMLVALKGHEKVALITDSIRAAGLADGIYAMADGDIIVANGSARLADGTLAGSMLTMDRAVANMVDFAGVSLLDALRMASATPAAILGIGERKGAIKPGMDADLVLLDENLGVVCTIVGGRVVYHVDS